MNSTIAKVIFPHVDELGSVPVLPATTPRGWDSEPVSEESEGDIAPDVTLPAQYRCREQPRLYLGARGRRGGAFDLE